MVSGGNRHGCTSEPGRVGGEVGMSLSSSVTAKPNAILGNSIRRELATGRKQQSCDGSILRPPGSCRVGSNRVIQKTQGLGVAGVRVVASGWTDGWSFSRHSEAILPSWNSGSHFNLRE